MNQNAFVVDASVAIKWFLNEVHSEKAREILTVDIEWLVPDLFYIETLSILTKKHRRTELSTHQVHKIAELIRKLPFTSFDSNPILAAATKISLQTQTSIYDSLYLTIAVMQDVRFLTADQKFTKHIQTTAFKNFVVFVDDI